MRRHEGTESQSQQRPAKIGHRKSRLGCLRCKQRRVKCDEQKPTCSNCERHGADCVYPEVRSSHSAGDDESENSQGTKSRRRSRLLSSIAYRGPPPVGDMFPTSLLHVPNDFQIPETEARRMLELRLMQNSLINLSQPISGRVSTQWLNLWQVVLPTLALHHENVLNAIMCLSATHILQEESSNTALQDARQNYLVLALQEQRQEVNEIHKGNVDAVCLTSILILLAAFAMLQERPLEPYEPPLDWLQMGRGAGAVMWKADAAVPEDIGARFSILVDPRIGSSDKTLNYTLPPAFAHVLSVLREEEELDEITEEAYRKTLSSIAGIQSALDNEESSAYVSKRVLAFPMVAPAKFADLVAEKRPRAMVILAFYLATVAQIKDDVWWCNTKRGGQTRIAVREAAAIARTLPREWLPLMKWPLEQVKKSGQ